MGRRRSIRFLLPHKPVEPEKIQRMLEAARVASHWGNVQSLRAVVVFRDSATQEVRDALLAPVAGFQIRLAPVVIVWFIETAAVDEQSDRLRELCKAGALGYGGGREKALEEKLIPFFDAIREGLKQPGVGEVDCGQGIAQATLMAFEQGLGTCCLGTPHSEKGQRPRQPFDQIFHMNGYGKPFPRSSEVVEELERDGLFQEPAPLPWREAELEYLKNALGLKGHGLL
jgi:nitroreductase